VPLRVVLRWFAAGAPFVWFGFATRFEAKSDIVGADFFDRFARRVHGTILGTVGDIGLVESLDDLRSPLFDPDKVHPVIRKFYEHTSSFDLDFTIRWNPLVRPFGWIYDRLLAKRMKQLIIPMDRDLLCKLDSWLEIMHFDKSDPDVRCWIRVDPESHLPVYVGAYKTYRSMMDGEPARYVSVAFPVPGGTITTVLTPMNFEGNEMQLDTRYKKSTENGLYIVIPHKRSFTMLPAFGLAEHFRLWPVETTAPPSVKVIHDCYWLGMRAFELHYQITEMRPRDISVAQSMKRMMAADRSPDSHSEQAQPSPVT